MEFNGGKQVPKWKLKMWWSVCSIWAVTNDCLGSLSWAVWCEKDTPYRCKGSACWSCCFLMLREGLHTHCVHVGNVCVCVCVSAGCAFWLCGKAVLLFNICSRNLVQNAYPGALNQNPAALYCLIFVVRAWFSLCASPRLKPEPCGASSMPSKCNLIFAHPCVDNTLETYGILVACWGKHTMSWKRLSCRARWYWNLIHSRLV